MAYPLKTTKVKEEKLMKTKLNYETVSIKITLLDTADVITTSGGNDTAITGEGDNLFDW